MKTHEFIFIFIVLLLGLGSGIYTPDIIIRDYPVGLILICCSLLGIIILIYLNLKLK